jgi:hypothetical protein
MLLLSLLLLLHCLYTQPHLQLEAWQAGGANLGREVLRTLVHPCSAAVQHAHSHQCKHNQRHMHLQCYTSQQDQYTIHQGELLWMAATLQAPPTAPAAPVKSRLLANLCCCTYQSAAIHCRCFRQCCFLFYQLNLFILLL